MVPITSASTAFYKWIFPAIAVGAGVMAIAVGAPSLAVLIIFAVAAVAFAFAFNLADYVLDAGSAVVTKIGRKEVHIDLRDIASVEATVFLAPRLVTLHLDESKYGRKRITFIPRVAGWSHPSGKGTAEDLMARVKEAHGTGAV